MLRSMKDPYGDRAGRGVGAAVGILLLVMTHLSQAGSMSEAADVVVGFQARLVEVMKRAEELGYAGRLEVLSPAVRDSHDLPTLARIVVGRRWETLTPSQRRRLVEVFSTLSVATYAYRFDGYSGERFELVSEQRTERGDARVRTRLIKGDGGEVRLDYLLRRDDGRWRIVNVIADGVSDLALKRAEYKSILRREGFEALISKLQNKIEQYAAAGP
jgi:phospholipid transport system substrate-binding protein